MRRLPVPDPGQPDARSATRYLLWLVRNQRSTILGGMFFGIVWMVSQALMPAVIGRTIDAGITHRDGGELVRWSALVLVLGATTATSGIMRHRNALVNFLAAAYSTVQVTTRQAARLGATLPRKVAAGDVVAIGTSDIAEIGGGLDVTARLSGAVVSIIAVAVIMLVTSLPLGLIVLLGVPILTALTGLLLRPLHERQRHFRARQGELTARAIDIAAGLRVLRGIGGEAAFSERYRRESQELRGAAVAVTRVESGLAAVEVLMPGVMVAGVTFLAARFAIDDRITVGELVAFYGYAAFLATPLRTLMEAADAMTRAHVAARRVVRILNLTPEIAEPEQPVSPPVGAVLAEAESGLEVPAGSLFAVACADPADAELLAGRLSRFDDSGRPTLGDVPLSAMSVAEVRARILLARNSDRFFTGSLREELDPRGIATDEEILAAVDVASAREVIEALPDGLDAEVVDGGRTFSGGQLQRLRLVRALLARREITILVEPTSAVDAHTEARIAEHLAAAGATVDPEGDGHRRRESEVRALVLAQGETDEAAERQEGMWSAGGPYSVGDLADGSSVSVGGAEGGVGRRTTVLFTTSPLLLDRAHRVAFVEDGRTVAVGTHRELLTSQARYAAVVTRGEDEG
jgi:ABC-type multidrug transport system fused ATPase/permease subunit